MSLYSQQTQINAYSSYYAPVSVEDEVNNLQLTSAVAAFAQTANALVTWNTSSTGPFDPASDRNLLKNNIVKLSDAGDFTAVNSIVFGPSGSTGLYSDGADLYYNGDKLATGGAGGITGPVSSTDNAIMRWDGTGGDQAQNSTATLADDGTLTATSFAVTDETVLISGINPIFRYDDGPDEYGGYLHLGTIAPLATNNTRGDILIGNNSLQLYNPSVETDNVIIGQQVAPSCTGANATVIIGSYGGYAGATYFDTCVIIGNNTCGTTGVMTRNVGVGFRVFNGSVITGTDNIAIGNYAGSNCAGNNNIIINNGATVTDGNNNLTIANAGVSGENNTIRVGNSSHDAIYVEGIGANVLDIPSAGYYPVVLGTGGDLAQGNYLTTKYRAGILSQSISASLVLPFDTDTLCNITTVSVLIDDAQFDMPSDGVLRYIGDVASIYALISVDGSVKMGTGTNQEIELTLKRNGTTAIRQQFLTVSAGNMAFSFQQWATISANDTLSLYVKNATAANDIVFTSFAINVTGSQ